MAYASRRLASLTSGDGWEVGFLPITEQVRKRARILLGAIEGDSSVYPSIAPDGHGGAVLHWVAGSQSIEIDLDHDGSSYVILTDVNGEIKLATGNLGLKEADLLKRHLAELSERVQQVNPHWRSQFSAA